MRRLLANLREDRPDVRLDPEKVTYTRGELAVLLDVKVCSITSLVKRHRLSGIGNGKARLYPAETALALVALRARGHSAKSANH